MTCYVPRQRMDKPRNHTYNAVQTLYNDNEYFVKVDL